MVDIAGYFAPPAAGGLWLQPLPGPVRVIDTRSGYPAIYAATGPIQFEQKVFNMRVGGVPEDARALSITGALIPRGYGGKQNSQQSIAP